MPDYSGQPAAKPPDAPSRQVVPAVEAPVLSQTEKDFLADFSTTIRCSYLSLSISKHAECKTRRITPADWPILNGLLPRAVYLKELS